MTDLPPTIPLSDYSFDACVQEAEKWPTLGPNYTAGRKIAEQFIAHFEAEHFAPLVDKFAKEMRDTLWTDVTEWLLTDTERNLHLEIQRRIDGAVSALLSGEQWALNFYVKDAKYGDAEKIRAAVAKHIPTELRDARIADLETENARLQNDLESIRRYR